MNKKSQALLLFSGGLDSILAAKILEEQGIEVTAITYVGHFFDATQAKKSAKENKIKLRIEDFSSEHFKIIKNPCFGRGAGMNPCVDCHLLMLKEAKKIAVREKYNFIATGEVLGQRPMSQNMQALKLIEKKAGLAGKIIRPLSAQVLPETEMEKYPRAKLSGKAGKPLVDRSRLFGISGRSRKEQMELAKKYKIKYYPSPAGGCILTEKEYSKKLRELLKKNNKPKASDIELLKIGRHFWSSPVRKSEFMETGDFLLKDKILKKSVEPKLSNGVGSTLIVIGRNHEENLKLKKIAKKGDVLIYPKDVPGPTALIRGEKIEVSIEASIETAKDKICAYAKKTKGKLEFEIRNI